MPIDSIAIGLTGTKAAQAQFAASASNVANQQSVAGESTAPDAPRRDEDGRTLFRPVRAVNESVDTGGVRASPMLVDPSAVQRFDPDAPDADEDGLVNRPNVRPEREIAEQISARAQFESSLATIAAADELLESVLDITA